MTKITVEIELDNEAYDRHYGPGSEWWAKYQRDHVASTEDGEPIYEPKPASEYEPMEGQLLRDAIAVFLSEGFYDWDKRGWLRLTIDGVAVIEPEPTSTD
jgi:hypothetical protein